MSVKNLGFHAYQGECESDSRVYKCSIVDKHFYVRLDDLSLEMGVLTFLDEKRTPIDIPDNIRFWLFEIKFQKPYKRGFLYDKQKEYGLDYHCIILLKLPIKK